MTDVVAALQDAWTELRIHRGRVLMSLVGVMLAIAALTASVALGELARSTITTSFEAQSGRAATLQFWVTPEVEAQPTANDHAATLDAIEAAVARYDVEYASARTSTALSISGPRGTVDAGVEGVEPDFAVMRHLSTVEGRFLTESDRARRAPAVVVNRAAAESLGADTTTQRAIEIGGTTAVVVGIIDRGFSDDWPQVWMLPRDVVRIAEASNGSVELGGFQLEAWVTTDQAEEGLRVLKHDLLTSLPGGSVDGNRVDWQAWSGGFDPLLPLQLTLVGTAVVILLLGALGLITVAVVSIRQRVREFGIRRAFGASRGRIFVAVMLESVVGTVAAGAVGIALCIFAYRLPIVQEMLMQGSGVQSLPGFPMVAAIIGLVVAAIVGALAGSIPATIAVRSKVIEAIRF